MTMKEVSKLLRLSEPTIRKLVDEGMFPEPIRFGERSLRWRKEILINFILKGGTNEH